MIDVTNAVSGMKAILFVDKIAMLTERGDNQCRVHFSGLDEDYWPLKEGLAEVIYKIMEAEK